ncbi:MAG: toll/interleukin-1 receptor domain-containing protein [Bacteroidetes bacterium]|nr:toll/interleukin-1 receptor domain-containing protein [Bacteroidota bacterium]
MRSVERLINATNTFTPIIIADNRQILLQLTEKVKTGIFESDYFVPILTRNSISSQWVNQEIGFANAINRKTIPIVEKQLIDILKGFIHKQLDLSYLFEGNAENKRSEASKFSSISKILVTDLLLENNVTPKVISLENLFPGKWRNIYMIADGRTGSEEFEIREGNKYIIKGKHMFNLENISIDLKKNKIKFKKVGIPPDNRFANDDINILEISKKYEGLEDGTTKISYYRID